MVVEMLMKGCLALCLWACWGYIMVEVWWGEAHDLLVGSKHPTGHFKDECDIRDLPLGVASTMLPSLFQKHRAKDSGSSTGTSGDISHQSNCTHIQLKGQSVLGPTGGDC